MRDAPDKKPRRFSQNPDGRKAPRLVTDEVREIDRNICNLLLKRHNLLDKIRKNGRLPAEDEKKLRESWQREVARISKDPELSVSFFSLMQNVSFMPRPDKTGENIAMQGARPRDAFNLAPPHLPLKLQMKAPLSSRLSRLWLYIASASGQAARLEPILTGNPLMNFIKTLEHLGVSLNRTLENVAVLPGEPLSRPDTVIHADNSEFNFYLFLAHYLGKPSRVKFTASSPLSLTNLSNLTAFLPSLGSRMISVIPKSSSLPARFECSGMLPPGIDFPADLSPMFAMSLAVAAMFYDQPFAINLSAHAEKRHILEQLQPLLDSCGAVWRLDNFTLNMEPCLPLTPKEPRIPMEDGVAAFLLAFAEPLRGAALLSGSWLEEQKQENLWNLLLHCGCAWKKTQQGVSNENNTIINKFLLDEETFARFSPLPEYAAALISSLAACACLAGGQSSLPISLLAQADVQDFLTAAGLSCHDSKLEMPPQETVTNTWNSPSPAWAMALALAACARHGKSGFRLGNPGIVTDWWAGFWNFYNSLPEPGAKSAKVPQGGEKKIRRIKTENIAVPREIREEDWN